MVVGPRYIPGIPVIVEEEQPKGSGTSLDTDRVSDVPHVLHHPSCHLAPQPVKPGEPFADSDCRGSRRQGGIAFASRSSLFTIEQYVTEF